MNCAKTLMNWQGMSLSLTANIANFLMKGKKKCLSLSAKHLSLLK